MDARERGERREAARREAESVEQDARRIRLLNTPAHRDLEGERGGELGEDARPTRRGDAIQPPNGQR